MNLIGHGCQLELEPHLLTCICTGTLKLPWLYKQEHLHGEHLDSQPVGGPSRAVCICIPPKLATQVNTALTIAEVE